MTETMVGVRTLVRSQRRLGDFGHPAAGGGQDRIVEIVGWTVEFRTLAEFAVTDPDESTGPMLQVEGEILAGHAGCEVAAQRRPASAGALMTGPIPGVISGVMVTPKLVAIPAQIRSIAATIVSLTGPR